MSRIWLSVFALALLAGCSTASKSTSDAGGESFPATMDKEGIRAAIRDHMVPIKHCYEKELKENPDLAGKLLLQFDIGAGGKVASTSVAKSVKPSVDECVAAVVRNTTFPDPPKGIIGRVVFPFVFSVPGSQ